MPTSRKRAGSKASKRSNTRQQTIPAGFNRKRLRTELAVRDSRLAELYDAAVNLLPSMQKPGSGYFLAHAARELTVAIVREITGRSHQAIRAKKDSSIGSTTAQEDKFSRIVATAFDIPRDHLSVRTWVALNNSFVKAAHVATGSKYVPVPETLVSEFKRLEQLMYGLVAPYFDTQDELDELAKIEHPTVHDVAHLRSLLIRHMQRQRFFSQLKNVNWFDELNRDKLLDPASEPATASGESPPLWYVWPEGEFVITCARADINTQTKVAVYLRSIPANFPNPSYWDVAVRAAIELPASLAVPLVANFKKVFSERRASIGSTLVQLARKLAIHNETGAAFILIYEIFSLVAQEDSSDSAHTWGERVVFRHLDSYRRGEACRQLLPDLEKLQPDRTLLFAKRLLDNALSIERKALDNNQVDPGADVSVQEPERPYERTYSEIWAKDLLAVDDEQSSAKEFAAGLVARLACKFVGNQTIPVQRVFDIIAGSADVHFRIELLVLAEADGTVSDRLARALDSLTFDSGLQWKQEFTSLIRKQWNAIPADARARFLDRIAAGPSRELILKYISHFATVPQSDVEIRERTQDWQRDMLDLFGPGLPTSDSSRIQQLRQSLNWSASDRRDILESEFPRLGTIRHSTPMAEEAFLLLQPEHALRLCMEWLTTQQDNLIKQRETLSGAVRLIAKYVGATSASGEALARGLIASRYPHFVEMALEVLLYKVERDELVSWDIVFELAGVIARGNDLHSDVANDITQHRTWRDARYTVLQAIEIATRKHKLFKVNKDKIWEILRLILLRPDTYDFPKEDHTCEVVDNQLRIPINTLAFSAVRNLVVFAHELTGVSTLNKKSSAKTRHRINHTRSVVQPKLRELLELSRSVADKLPGIRSVDAAIGRFLPMIAYMDTEWVKQMRTTMLRGDSDIRVAPAWAAFVSSHDHPSFEMVDLVLDSYQEMAAFPRGRTVATQREPLDANPDVGLVKHAFSMAVRGNPAFGTRTKLLKQIVGRANSTDLVSAYFNVSYGLRDNSVSGGKRKRPLINNAIVGGFVQLWRWRISSLKSLENSSQPSAEADGLCWLFLIDDLPGEVAVSLMRQTASLLDHRSRTASLAWRRLASMVEKALNDVFSIAQHLISLELKETHAYNLSNDHIYAILEHVTTHGSVVVAAKARRLAHRLGEKGYSNFKLIAQEPTKRRKTE